MIVPLPEDLTRTISTLALQNVRAFTLRRNWSNESSASFASVTGVGIVGVQTNRRYLLYQDRGIRPFVMWSLEGKIIPMGDGQFRRAKGVGSPGWVTLPGGVRRFRQQKWRHPGLQPLHFMEDSIAQAITDLQPQLVETIRRRLEGEVV